MLPNFFVIGAYKSGTTSLYHYLSQHPQVFVPQLKEPNYFAFADVERSVDSSVFRKSVKTRAEYERLFQESRNFVAIGDVSPEYMTSPSAARAIKRSVPEARLIAILRNPVERAYSDYLMYRRDGKEQMTDFAKALEAQPERASRFDPTGFYVSTGFYGEQLARYYDVFPAARIKVYQLEDLQSSATRTLSHMFDFLGVESTFAPKDLDIYNRSGVTSNYLVNTLFRYKSHVAPLARLLVPKRLRAIVRQKIEAGLSKPPLLPEVRQMLIETYRADVHRLEQLTGQSFRNWLQ
jgi:hypothetical protein